MSQADSFHQTWDLVLSWQKICIVLKKFDAFNSIS